MDTQVTIASVLGEKRDFMILLDPESFKKKIVRIAASIIGSTDVNNNCFSFPGGKAEKMLFKENKTYWTAEYIRSIFQEQVFTLYQAIPTLSNYPEPEDGAKDFLEHYEVLLILRALQAYKDWEERASVNQNIPKSGIDWTDRNKRLEFRYIWRETES